MNAPAGHGAATTPSAPGGARPAPGRPAGEAVCPYLVAANGAWRGVHASREHRCHAVEPPVMLAISKQRALCLAADHLSCATYLAAGGSARSGDRGAQDDGTDLWPEVHTVPIVLEAAHGRLGPLPVGGSRFGTQVVLAVLMVAALLVLVLARLMAPPIDGPAAATPAGGATASPGATAIASPRPSPSATASAGPSASAAPTPVVTEVPSPATPPPTAPPAAPLPSVVTTPYTVQAGDTLSTIASRFGTTVSVLVALNGITDPSLIRIGQVLRVPAP